MTRVKSSVVSHLKKKKILKQAKGYYGSRSRSHRIANQSIIKSGQYSYIHRRHKKRNMRKLWIMRINAASREHNLTYSKLIFKLKINSIIINRKMLSNIILNNNEYFLNLIKIINN
ncbi:50S ribosomal protein L20 [endosymbiont of Sipalinus gigas]|uniref:50S ribosomal protein L20 n=1 Tax=endosymbiont of Sipalinus gigas TaxID=1972134 RepID=UPI000DC730CA|nr:50S ribosomal protein L20 [endosymbiont of Sipalinus gigas]BBA85231.1 50S ribosomal protein L20 [endosymbiont of Sipalinus gigas]